MSLSSVAIALLRKLHHRHPLLRYAAAWTALLTSMVFLTSFSPEMAFAWALTPSSPFARSCQRGFVRLPVDGPPGPAICVPSRLIAPSKADLIVPPVFAAFVVAGSACIVWALGLWDLGDSDEESTYPLY
ncbi:uncharacterized protein LOC110038593 [Phalaenopsis equestris]|uniref:uncharacterized protein LOC110038593 n=1 Tax=Phalaenopsis equestris TaxID=78828 RepID=UPI0009E490C4|nr:uncharacterized protein LOC110038593 [Phalaenopsis equestris]